MMLKRKLDGKGRLNIPFDVLDQLSIDSDAEVFIDIEDNKIIIIKNVDYNEEDLKKCQT